MRPRRPGFLRGHFYHIYNRGAHGVSIFREEDNYYFVLRKIKHYAAELELSVIAYCLMPNHYHFLLRQDGDYGAGMLPQRVFNSYSKAYNKLYEHSGTLFQGPYKVIQINHQRYLLHLCRYIHANPLKDGLVDELGSWPYSNYLEWVSVRSGKLIDRDFVKEHFPTPGTYQVFLDEYLLTRAVPDEIQSYLIDWGVD